MEDKTRSAIRKMKSGKATCSQSNYQKKLESMDLIIPQLSSMKSIAHVRFHR